MPHNLPSGVLAVSDEQCHFKHGDLFGGDWYAEINVYSSCK